MQFNKISSPTWYSFSSPVMWGPSFGKSEIKVVLNYWKFEFAISYSFSLSVKIKKVKPCNLVWGLLTKTTKPQHLVIGFYSYLLLFFSADFDTHYTIYYGNLTSLFPLFLYAHNEQKTFVKGGNEGKKGGGGRGEKNTSRFRLPLISFWLIRLTMLYFWAQI